MTEKPSYDRSGRMKYHPEYHPNHNKPWTTSEQAYLIENYDSLGPEQVSLAIGKTIHTVMTRAYTLRKAGLMKKPAKPTFHRRTGSLP